MIKSFGATPYPSFEKEGLPRLLPSRITGMTQVLHVNKRSSRKHDRLEEEQADGLGGAIMSF